MTISSLFTYKTSRNVKNTTLKRICNKIKARNLSKNKVIEKDTIQKIRNINKKTNDKNEFDALPNLSNMDGSIIMKNTEEYEEAYGYYNAEIEEQIKIDN